MASPGRPRSSAISPSPVHSGPGSSRAGAVRSTRVRAAAAWLVSRALRERCRESTRWARAAVARIARREPVGGRRRLLEPGEAGPALEQQQVLDRRGGGGRHGFQPGFQGVRAHGLLEPRLARPGVGEQHGPAPLAQELVRRDDLGGVPARLPGARGHQALGLPHHVRAVREPLQGLEPHPVGPEHHARAARGPVGHGHGQVAGGVGALEQGAAAEPGRHLAAQLAQLGLVLAPGVQRAALAHRPGSWNRPRACW